MMNETAIRIKTDLEKGSLNSSLSGCIPDFDKTRSDRHDGVFKGNMRVEFFSSLALFKCGARVVNQTSWWLILTKSRYDMPSSIHRYFSRCSHLFRYIFWSGSRLLQGRRLYRFFKSASFFFFFLWFEKT
jgi:hypothetical protein